MGESQGRDEAIPSSDRFTEANIERVVKHLESGNNARSECHIHKHSYSLWSPLLCHSSSSMRAASENQPISGVPISALEAAISSGPASTTGSPGLRAASASSCAWQHISKLICLNSRQRCFTTGSRGGE